MPDTKTNAEPLSLVEAAKAVLQAAMDNVEGRVHPCDRGNWEVMRHELSPEMQALYLALKDKV